MMTILSRPTAHVPGRRPGSDRAAFVAVLALLLSLLAGLAGPPAAVAGAGRGVLQVWSPAATGSIRNLERTRAVQVARDFDLVLAHGYSFREHVPAMRAANPRLRLLAYVNGTFAGSAQGSAYPAAWYVRDTEGNKARSVFYGNYMMNPNNPGWRATRTDECRTSADANGYDGCYLDVLGPAPVSPGYVTGTPVNPATGRPWTYAEWLGATSSLAGSARTAVAPRVVQGNGLTDGVRYFHPYRTRVLFTPLDAVIAEGFVRKGRDPLTLYPTVSDWKKNVDMLVDAESRGKGVLALTKLWAPGSSATKNAWHEFTLATFLLGANGRSHFYLSVEESQSPLFVHPWWRTDLGLPTGPYTRSGDVFSRTFAKGRVLVNPSTSTVTVPLDGTYRRLDGTVVTSSVTLPPHQARVLVRD